MASRFAGEGGGGSTVRTSDGVIEASGRLVIGDGWLYNVHERIQGNKCGDFVMCRIGVLCSSITKCLNHLHVEKNYHIYAAINLKLTIIVYFGVFSKCQDKFCKAEMELHDSVKIFLSFLSISILLG